MDLTSIIQLIGQNPLALEIGALALIAFSINFAQIRRIKKQLGKPIQAQPMKEAPKQKKKGKEKEEPGNPWFS